MKRDPEQVSMAIREDVRIDTSIPDEWIIIGRAAVGIQSEDFSG